MAHIALDQPFRPSQITVGTTIERKAVASSTGHTVLVTSPCCGSTWRIQNAEFEYVQDRGWSLDRKCSGCDYRYTVGFPQDKPFALVTARGDGPGKGWRKKQ